MGRTMSLPVAMMENIAEKNGRLGMSKEDGKSIRWQKKRRGGREKENTRK
jgi:hypothetical protein